VLKSDKALPNLSALSEVLHFRRGDDKALPNLSALSEVLHFRRGDEDVFLGYDDVLLGNGFPQFRENMLVLSSRLEMSWTFRSINILICV